MRLKNTLVATIIATFFACTASVAMADSTDPDLQGLPSGVPSTSISQPSAADPDASNQPDAAANDNSPDDQTAIQKVDQIDGSTMQETTPPGTSSDPTKQFDSGSGEYSQHQLFFTIKDAPCGQSLKITLLRHNNGFTNNTNNNLADKAKTDSDFIFAAVTSADKMLQVMPDGNVLTIKIPQCTKQETNQTKTDANITNGNANVSQEQILDEANKMATDGSTDLTEDGDGVGNNPVSTNVNSVGDGYNFSVMVKVPSQTKIISLNASFDPSISLTVNTVGKDPTIMSSDIETLVNIKP